MLPLLYIRSTNEVVHWKLESIYIRSGDLQVSDVVRAF